MVFAQPTPNPVVCLHEFNITAQVSELSISASCDRVRSGPATSDLNPVRGAKLLKQKNRMPPLV